MKKPTPWVIVMCRFKDDLSSPASPLALYEKLFTSAGTGTYNVVKYFNDISQGTLDLSGSQVFPVPLTINVNHFDYTPNEADPKWKQKVDRNLLFQRIKESALAAGIITPQFYGILAIFNVGIGIPFGSMFPTPHAITDDRIDLKNNAVRGGPSAFGHEMGHAYGLEHSRMGLVDEPRGERWDYQDPWDIMSYGRIFNASDPNFTFRGVGLNAWNMRSRAWMDESRIKHATANTFDEVVDLRPVMRYDLPGALAAELPPLKGGAGRYLVEFRIKDGWDAGIPRSAVLVHRFSEINSYILSGAGVNSAWLTAQTGPNSGFDVWQQFGNVQIGKVTIGRNQDGRLEVFALDTSNGSVLHARQNAPGTGFGAWQQLGDAVGLEEFAVDNNADGRLELFAVDGAARLAWHNWQVEPNGGWHGWERLFDAVGLRQIVVGHNADGRLEVFATDTSAGLAWHNWQVEPNGGWHGWERLFDAVGLGQIAVGHNADGRLEVFAFDNDAGLAWHNWQVSPNGGWHGWERIFDAAGLGRHIIVGRNRSGLLEVFALDREKGFVLHTRQLTLNGGFGAWRQLGDAVGFHELAVSNNADGRLELFAVSPDGGLAWHTAQDAPDGDFGSWAPLGIERKGFTRIAAARNGNGRIEAVAIDGLGHPDIGPGERMDFIAETGFPWIPRLAISASVQKIDEKTQTATVRLTSRLAL